MLDVARPVVVVDAAAAGGSQSESTEVKVHVVRRRGAGVKRVQTISGVTAEADAVFEHLLRRTHSDSVSSGSGGRRPATRRRPLTAIAETTDGRGPADEPTDDWATRNSVSTRLSSTDGLDDVEGPRPRVPSDYQQQWSRDSLDAVASKFSYDTRLSSTDGLDQSQSVGQSGYSSVFLREDQLAVSRDSTLGVVTSKRSSGGRHPAAQPSLASVSVELEDGVSDADDETKKREMAPKKKKSWFKRVRERLSATFGREDERNRAAHKAAKYMHTNGGSSSTKRNFLTASFRRKRKKPQSEFGESSTLPSTVSSADHRQYQTIDRNGTGDGMPAAEEHKPKRMFSRIQRRLSSIRVKRSQSRGAESPGTPVSQSGDEVNIHSLSKSQQRLLAKYTGDSSRPVEDADQPRPGVSGDELERQAGSRQGHHSIRGRLELDIQHPSRPLPADGLPAAAVVVDVEPLMSSDLEERVKGWDFIDGGPPAAETTQADTEPVLHHATARSFSQKSPAEKQELYEHIASKLMSIGDGYTVGSPSGNDASGCVASPLATDNPSGTLTVDVSGIAGQLLETASNYGGFQSVVNEALREESGGLQQIAFVFQLSKAAMQYAGSSSDLAGRIKNMTMRYFEQYFAPWIVQQGGWESVVEESDSELD